MSYTVIQMWNWPFIWNMAIYYLFNLNRCTDGLDLQNCYDSNCKDNRSRQRFQRTKQGLRAIWGDVWIRSCSWSTPHRRLLIFPAMFSYAKNLQRYNHQQRGVCLLINVLNLESGFYFPQDWVSIPSRQYCRHTMEAIFGPFHHSNSLPAHPYFIRPRL